MTLGDSYDLLAAAMLAVRPRKLRCLCCRVNHRLLDGGTRSWASELLCNTAKGAAKKGLKVHGVSQCVSNVREAGEVISGQLMLIPLLC